MTVKEYYQQMLFVQEGEKPLDRMAIEGGLCGIFRTMGCIGDSLSSGEFESLTPKGEKGYHDYYEYSWGQYLARHSGLTLYNFSKGGMTASEYWNTFAEENGFWAEEKLCQAYLIALGVNDLFGQNQPLGSVADVHPEDWNQNADTFAGYYARIIQRLKSMQPKARFFLLTMPRELDDRETIREAHAKLLYDMANLFEYTYVIDLHRYGPVYDEAFKQRCYLGGHLNPAGYLFTARMVESYIDYLIRKNPEDFTQAGFIGTPYRNASAKW